MTNLKFDPKYDDAHGSDRYWYLNTFIEFYLWYRTGKSTTIEKALYYAHQSVMKWRKAVERKKAGDVRSTYYFGGHSPECDPPAEVYNLPAISMKDIGYMILGQFASGHFSPKMGNENVVG